MKVLVSKWDFKKCWGLEPAVLEVFLSRGSPVVLCRASWREKEGKHGGLMLTVMASSYGPGNLVQEKIATMEQEIRRLRKLLRDQNRVVLKLDEEGGQ